MDVVGRCELDEEAGDYVGEEDGAFGDVGADEVEGGGEEEDVEDVVYEAWITAGLAYLVLRRGEVHVMRWHTK